MVEVHLKTIAIGGEPVKKTSTYLAVATAVALATGGCGNTESLGPGSERDPAPQRESASVAAPEEAQEEAAEELEADEAEASDEEWRFVEEFAEPFVWEEGGVRLSVTGIGITDATSPEVPAEVSELLGEETQAVVVLEMTASNDTGQVVNFFPGQGSIQLLREQVDAELFLSDSIAGNDWRDGVDGDGQVFWSLQNTPFKEAVEAGELTFVAGGASSQEFATITDDVEITVTWG
ncbi:hypothetical protein GC088_14590 [Arthrobacter sp. JZ12]|uniref:hypothetical protein n=1 Tax=Arthrobacter sp. JZ12 TaxID=2654190 RepID=UPI002B46C10C|nr:hypothetical protein [Arthrobacter sp. JZ12]WRH26174.1 hypothetical protein GC088_14590 [Arthrobacter sp. JZ12]